MENYTLIFVLISIIGILFIVINQRNKKNKEIAKRQSQATTFEDKMLLLQEFNNERLKSIDTTLDWFFWLMILSFVVYILGAIFSVF